jgi:hypothetical protein
MKSFLRAGAAMCMSSQSLRKAEKGKLKYYFEYKRVGKGERLEGYKRIQLNSSARRWG